MRRRPNDVPAAGWLLNGVRYQTEAEYRGALHARDERRRRLLERIERDRRGDG